MSTNMRMDSLFSRFLYFVICLTGFTGKTLLLSNVKSSMKGDLSRVRSLKLQELLSSEFWRFHFYQSFEYEWQPTLFQPVGGMDKIVDGFVRKIGPLIQYNSKVLDINTS